jgi:proline iminopeptidase
VGDIEALREHLGLGKIMLFGGSWGATLALAYAEQYPDNVSGMVLRGVFAATSEEIDHFYHGGVATYFPDVYEKFVRSLPEPDRRPLPSYLLELIQSEDPEQRDRYSLIWATYEAKVSMLEITDEAVANIWKTHNPLSFSLLENYYMANRCFLEEGQLMREAEKLRGIPLIIVSGRYDTICPPRTAYKLHKKVPGSKLVIVESAGHWMGDPKMEQALLQAVRGLE